MFTLGYLLSRKEKRLGSPEKPLSDLGLLSYRQYWRTTMVRALLFLDSDNTTIQSLSQITGMNHEDIIETLQLMDLLQYNSNGDPLIYIDLKELKEHDSYVRSKGYGEVKEELLKWDPILLHRMIETEQQEKNGLDGAASMQNI